MAYPEQYQLGEDPAFQRRVQIALTSAAATVVQAPPSANVEIARGILQDIATADPIAPVARRVARIAVTLPSVAATAPTGGALSDAQLLSVVAAILPFLTR